MVAASDNIGEERLVMFEGSHNQLETIGMFLIKYGIPGEKLRVGYEEGKEDAKEIVFSAHFLPEVLKKYREANGTE